MYLPLPADGLEVDYLALKITNGRADLIFTITADEVFVILPVVIEILEYCSLCVCIDCVLNSSA